MNTKRTIWTIAWLGATTILMVAGCSNSYQPGAEQAKILSSRELAVWIEAIRPKEDDVKWQQIPWVSTLVEAREIARTEGRPIFLWVLDDEPFDRC